MTIQHRASTLLGLAAAAGIAVTAGGVHLRAQAANFTAQTTVPSTCSVTATDINFGVYDPAHANKTVPKDAEGQITLSCTQGLAPVLTLLSGEGTATGVPQLYNGNNFLTYQMFKDSARTQQLAFGDEIARPTDFLVNGGTITIPVYGRLLAGQMHARSGDSYNAGMNVSMVY